MSDTEPISTSPSSESAPRSGPAPIPVVQAQLDSIADLTLSQARTQLGKVLLATGRTAQAADQFTAAVGDAPDLAQRARLMLLQAYARDCSDEQNQALRGYLDAVR